MPQKFAETFPSSRVSYTMIVSRMKIILNARYLLIKIFNLSLISMMR